MKLKRLLLVILSLAAAICMLFAFTACGTPYDDKGNGGVVTPGEGSEEDDTDETASKGIELAINSDGESYSVIGIGTCEDTDIVLPSKYKGKPVTMIGDEAFLGCEFKSVKIPDSVTVIGEQAFRACDGLTSITIPGSVTEIGEQAFCVCRNLAEITIFGNKTVIGEGAFRACYSLTSATIGNGVSAIGEYAFDSCGSLTTITIPASVTVIGEGAFCFCEDLETITVDPENPVYHSQGNCIIETASQTLIAGCNNSVIPSDGSVTVIGSSAFSYCQRLTDIGIPDCVTEIGNYAFLVCISLESVEIPASVTAIGEGAFNFCDSLETIIVNPENPVYHSQGNCIIETASQTLIAGCNNSVIPSDGSVTVIGSSAFSYCKGLTSIEIPASVTEIGNYAFLFCVSLESINIPASVTVIGEGAFRACDSLKSIELPDSVTEIGSYAFSICAGLESIKIPASVTMIGDYAFHSCSSLTEIDFSGTKEQWNLIAKGAFWDCDYDDNSDETLHVQRSYTVRCTNGNIEINQD